MTTEPKAPLRLAKTDGPAGDCLRQVLAEQEQEQALPRFAALRERRARRSRRWQSALLLMVTSTGLFAAWTWRAHEAERPASIRAEVVSESRTSVASAASVATVAPVKEAQVNDAVLQEARNKEARVSEPLTVSSTSTKPARSKTAIARSSQDPSPALDMPTTAELAPAAPEPSAKGGAKACAQLAREGAAERALACYEELAAGGGITAELAIFEQARLEGKLMRRPDRALLRLDSYRQRFPNGSLRAEVMLAQIDWLVTTGKSGRALELVEEALASGLLRERRAELERVRKQLQDERR